MRGTDHKQNALFSYVNIEDRIPALVCRASQPLRGTDGYDGMISARPV